MKYVIFVALALSAVILTLTATGWLRVMVGWLDG